MDYNSCRLIVKNRQSAYSLAIVLRDSMRNTYSCGFDLGGTKMLCIVMDDTNKIVVRKRKKTKGTEGVQAGVSRIAELVRETFTENNLPISELGSLGIGCPGPVDMDKGIVNVAVNLGWKDVHLAAMLADELGCPVAVLNDVDSGVYGEYSLGVAVGARSVAGIFPGTGIGGGFVYEGQILRGKRSSAMEIGHTKIATSSRNSGIEMTGTLESEASRLAIAAECAKLAYRGEAPSLMKAVGTDISQMRSKVLAAAIRDGDKSVERVVLQSANTVGFAVVNLVHLLCPEVIVLGGGLVEAIHEIYLNEVIRTAKQNVLSCYSDMFEVKIAKLGDDAGAIGAAIWGKQQAAQHSDASILDPEEG